MFPYCTHICVYDWFAERLLNRGLIFRSVIRKLGEKMFTSPVLTPSGGFDTLVILCDSKYTNVVQNPFSHVCISIAKHMTLGLRMEPLVNAVPKRTCLQCKRYMEHVCMEHPIIKANLIIPE